VDGTLVLHDLSLLHHVCNKQKIPSLTYVSLEDGDSVSSEALDLPTRIQQGAVTRDNIAGVSWEWAARYCIPTVPFPY